MLTWTTRRTPASSAARMSDLVFATAVSNEIPPRGNRTQYVLYRTSTSRRLATIAAGSSKA